MSITPGGNPVCELCGRWYGLGVKHECDRPSIEDVLAEHLWADRRNQTCGCGWVAGTRWMTDRSAPNRVEQHLTHVAEQIHAAGWGTR